MKAYEAGTAAYFATPPVNLIYAFHAALSSITQSQTTANTGIKSTGTNAVGNVSLEDRFRLHREKSDKFKKAMEDLGLKQVPLEEGFRANGMTAVSRIFAPHCCEQRGPRVADYYRCQLYYPEGLVASDILPRLVKKQIVVAGGLHKEIKGKRL